LIGVETKVPFDVAGCESEEVGSDEAFEDEPAAEVDASNPRFVLVTVGHHHWRWLVLRC